MFIAIIKLGNCPGSRPLTNDNKKICSHIEGTEALLHGPDHIFCAHYLVVKLWAQLSVVDPGFPRVRRQPQEGRQPTILPYYPKPA